MSHTVLRSASRTLITSTSRIKAEKVKGHFLSINSFASKIRFVLFELFYWSISLLINFKIHGNLAKLKINGQMAIDCSNLFLDPEFFAHELSAR